MEPPSAPDPVGTGLSHDAESQPLTEPTDSALPAHLTGVYAPLVFVTVWVATTVLVNLCSPDSGWIRWTVDRLRGWIRQEFGLECSNETVRRALKRLGLSWKKARKLLAKACTQARRQFLVDFRDLVRQANDGRLLLVFCDEAHIHLDADLGYGWAKRGLPFWIHSSSPGLQKTSFYGLYLYNYQSVRIWAYPRANGDHTCDMLTRLRQEFPEHLIVVVWDGASYHRSEAVMAHAAQLNITLVRLPAYSPDFMPVESLWRWLRQEVTSLHCHYSVEELIDRVADFAWSVNMDPITVSRRLPLKSQLNPIEEKLRF